MKNKGFFVSLKDEDIEKEYDLNQLPSCLAGEGQRGETYEFR